MGYFAYRPENVHTFRILGCGFWTRYNRFFATWGALAVCVSYMVFRKFFFFFLIRICDYLVVRETVMTSGR